MLSNHSIKQYKEIFKNEFGQDLTDDEAREQGERLVKFFEILLKIDHRVNKNHESSNKNGKTGI